RMARHAAGRGQALGEGRHALHGLQRILRRDQPPDIVEPEPLERQAAEMQMAGMRRVEGAAEQADARAPRRPGRVAAERPPDRDAEARALDAGARPIQGRTWPVPWTAYL